MNIELGRRVVACVVWPHPAPQMPMLPGLPSLGAMLRAKDSGVLWRFTGTEWVPDTSDAATLAVVIGIVRWSWGDPSICCVAYKDVHDDVLEWECSSTDVVPRGPTCTTEEAAAVGALEIAPARAVA